MITALIVGVLVIAALVFGFYSGAMSARRELADRLAMARQDHDCAKAGLDTIQKNALVWRAKAESWGELLQFARWAQGKIGPHEIGSVYQCILEGAGKLERACAKGEFQGVPDFPSSVMDREYFKGYKDGFALIRTLQEATEFDLFEQRVQRAGLCVLCRKKLRWPSDGGEGT